MSGERGEKGQGVLYPVRALVGPGGSKSIDVSTRHKLRAWQRMREDKRNVDSAE